MENIQITALGEILIDYTPLPDSDAGMQATICSFSGRMPHFFQ